MITRLSVFILSRNSSVLSFLLDVEDEFNNEKKIQGVLTLLYVRDLLEKYPISFFLENLVDSNEERFHSKKKNRSDTFLTDLVHALRNIFSHFFIFVLLHSNKYGYL